MLRKIEVWMFLEIERKFLESDIGMSTSLDTSWDTHFEQFLHGFQICKIYLERTMPPNKQSLPGLPAQTCWTG